MTTGATQASYAVREFKAHDQKRWDELVAASPGGGHALQSFTWAEFKKSQGWKPLRLVLEKDGQVAGTGQFLLYNTLPVPGYLMYAPKGPWIDYDEPDAVSSFFDGLRQIALQHNVHTIKIEPEVHEERSEVRSRLAGAGFHDARYDLNFDTTIVVDLSPSEEDLMAAMGGKTTRYNVRLAGRKGVEVYRPDDFEWAWKTFMGWLEDTAERKEGFTNRRPRSYFHEMMAEMHDAGQGHFFFAAHEGQPLSGVFLFTFGEKCWFMHGASGREKKNLKPTYLLQWEIMRWLKARGVTYYDMVGVPKEEDRHEGDPYYGVYKFKKGFGGDVVQFIGCMDLPVKPRLAKAWYELEPFYYRAYYKLKGNIFY